MLKGVHGLTFWCSLHWPQLGMRMAMAVDREVQGPHFHGLQVGSDRIPYRWIHGRRIARGVRQAYLERPRHAQDIHLRHFMALMAQEKGYLFE